MSLNKDKFYQSVRASLFGGSLKQSQVNGMDCILNEWNNKHFTDLRWLAYMLGTTFHETARTMQPIEEWGKGQGLKYGKPDPITGKTYYGRGFVQLTWKANYQKMGDLLGVDLVHQPDLALRADVATEILFEGMLTAKSYRGDFTGRSLEQYFNATTEDWVGARRIINGLDKASQIAAYSKEFHKALI